MKITNEFTVHTPIERAWALLTDLEGIAPCLPGAHLTGVEGETYSGKVKVKVGPVVSDFAGTARFVEKDDVTHRAVIDAKGRDSRSAGNAAAVVTAQLRADGDRTLVNVDTDLKISGKLAQFGSGMIREVSGKLLGQFVTNLEAKLAAEEVSTDEAAVPGAMGADASDAGTGAAEQREAATAPGAATLPSAASEGTTTLAGVDTPEGASLEGVTTPEEAATPADLAVPLVGVPAAGAGRTSLAPNGFAPSSEAEKDATASNDAGAAVSAAGNDAGMAVSAGNDAGSAVSAASDNGAAASEAAAGGAGAGTASTGEDTTGTVAAGTDAGVQGGRTAGGGATGAVPRGGRALEADEPEALDLLALAGGSVYKRVIPLGIGAVVVAAVIVWFVARR